MHSICLLVTLIICGTQPVFASAPSTANLWIDANGGSCSRSAVAASYADSAACATLDAAWDATSPGDVIVIKSGTYGPQAITGNKISPGVTIIGEINTVIGALDTNGTFLTLQDVTVDVGNAHQAGWSTGADNITLRNVNLRGPFVTVGIGNNNISWLGGEFGVAGQVGGQRNFCGVDGEPITIFGANNVTFDKIKFHPQATTSDPNCNHMEYLRIDGGGSNFTLRKSVFDSGDGATTATVFVTNTSAGTTYSGLKMENNFFGTTNASSGNLQVHGNVATCSSWTVAYNTYKDYPGAWTCSMPNTLWVGNLGPYASSSPCSGIHTKNVWQHNVRGSCGTDTWIIGNAFRTEALGLGGTDGFHLQSGSAAINAAEASGYCTSNLGGVDIEGDRRPNGATCDAGADEFGGSVSGPLPPNPPSGLSATVR